MLASLSPRLAESRYAFEAVDEPALAAGTFALVREPEGVTAVRPTPAGEWAMITLEVHSSLEAVGLTAAFSEALASAGISANVIAGLRHDHIFVPWHQRDQALAALTALSSGT